MRALLENTKFLLHKVIIIAGIITVLCVYRLVIGCLYVDSYSKWIRQKSYQYFINKKLKKQLYFLTCILPNYVPHEMGKHFATCAVPLFGSTLFSHMCSSSIDLWIVCTYFPTCAVPSKYALPYSPTCAVPARIWTSNSWLMYGRNSI